jgi:ferredoxin
VMWFGGGPTAAAVEGQRGYRQDMVTYPELAAAVAATGMVARGGFVATPDDAVPASSDSTPVHTVVMIGNVGGTMWPRFRAEQRDEPDPLDRWTRRILRPIAERYGAGFVHPSDEPFRPFQRWAQRAADVWPSPIGILIHPTDGLWHAYRGAFLFTAAVTGLPATGLASSPCVGCAAPCLSTCPVDAFAPGS